MSSILIAVIWSAVGLVLANPEVKQRGEVDQTGGITLSSPDRKWLIVATPPTTQSGNAQLILKDSGHRLRQLLCEYYRSGTVAWSPDSKAIVFIDDHSIEDSRLKIFRLSESGATQIRDADAVLRRYALKSIPRRDVQFYTIHFIGFDLPTRVALDVNVEYMPHGRQTGPRLGSLANCLFDLRLVTAAAREK